MPEDRNWITGVVEAVLLGPDGKVKGYCKTHNIITNVGDQVYAERGSLFSGAAAGPTGAKLGTGSTAVAKSGAGSALTTYLADSHLAVDGGFPTSTLNAAKRDIAYRFTYNAGKATSAATPITEAVIVNAALTDATSLEAATLARVLLAGIGSKAAADTLTLTWTHTIGT